ncbi:TolC family protein [Flavobacterium sp. HSC-61S13]|uniref:TolC family protein n=1 Tax=Flavobacterium sp. HSC-61S13 TaxID=2910963 RepID=UPI00209E69DC|nr:TolC family protein [Flavobacterium sp. HSC-61S13]MCP1996096.1 NodT family efflux transporter outer membrane factor (OMF) lipoprotein [Flavobacterium sp. HSC-61S13]
MIKNIIIVITVLALTALSGCKVSKVEIDTPMNAFPDKYRTDNLMAEGPTIGQLSWRSFFQDEQLIQLIEIALKRNSDVLIALQNIEISKWHLKNAQGGNIPDVQLEIYTSRAFPSEYNALVNQNNTHIDDFKVDLAMSWEADIWGKIKNQKKADWASYLQSGETKNAVQTALVAQIAQCYYNLVILDNQMGLVQKNIELSKSTTTAIQLQFEAGKSTSLALEQSKVQELEAEKLIPNLQLQILIQENVLSALTGVFPDTQQRQQSLQYIGIINNVQIGIPAILLSQRPDVKSAELDLKIANANVGIAQAAFYPTLTLSANGGLLAFKASDWFNIPASVFGMVAGGISQPILQRRTIKTKYQIALANREKAVIKFRAAVLSAVTEVSNALVQLDKQKEQQVILVKQREALENNIVKVKMLFTGGRANYLEILTTQNNLLTCDMNYTISKRDELFARIELYRVLGGGWQ